MTKNGQGELLNKILITIVTRNNKEFLTYLIESINKFDAGWPYDLLIVDAESDNQRHLAYLEELSKVYKVRHVVDDRVEVSYNVAWNENKNYEYYLFLHEDCYVERDGWLKVFVDRMNSGYCEPEIVGTHLAKLPIGRVSITSQYWRDYTSVKGHPVSCQFLKPVLDVLYPGKAPEIIKYAGCDRLLIRNEVLQATDGFRNLKEFREMKEQNPEKFKQICSILATHLNYHDVGAYPDELYPPGQFWSRLTLVTEFLASVEPLIYGWRSVGLYDDGYLEQIQGRNTPTHSRYIVHYGSPTFLRFAAEKFNYDSLKIKKYFRDKAFMVKCDKFLKKFFEENE